MGTGGRLGKGSEGRKGSGERKVGEWRKERGEWEKEGD